jgi:putative methyltransferase (TIGR04325 family)
MSAITRVWKSWKRISASGPQFELVRGGWSEARCRIPGQGWNAESVVEIQGEALADWQRPLRTTEPLGTGLVPAAGQLNLHNTLVSFAYVAALARQGDRLSLLDWGGGAGQYGWLAQSVLPNVTVEYFCKDVPVQCAAGRNAYPQGTFFTSDDEFQGHRFDLVLASGSLQYAEDWPQVLHRLAAATDRYLFVTRLPVVTTAESFVVRQRAYRSEYLGWTLNREEFLTEASDLKLQLVREFVLGESHHARGAPEASTSRGFLFRPAMLDQGPLQSKARRN